MNKDKVVIVNLDDFKNWCKYLSAYYEDVLSSDYSDGISAGLRMAFDKLEDKYNEQR